MSSDTKNGISLSEKLLIQKGNPTIYHRKSGEQKVATPKENLPDHLVCYHPVNMLPSLMNDSMKIFNLVKPFNTFLVYL